MQPIPHSHHVFKKGRLSFESRHILKCHFTKYKVLNTSYSSSHALPRKQLPLQETRGPQLTRLLRNPPSTYAILPSTSESCDQFYNLEGRYNWCDLGSHGKYRGNQEKQGISLVKRINGGLAPLFQKAISHQAGTSLNRRCCRRSKNALKPFVKQPSRRLEEGRLDF